MKRNCSGCSRICLNAGLRKIPENSSGHTSSGKKDVPKESGLYLTVADHPGSDLDGLGIGELMVLDLRED